MTYSFCFCHCFCLCDIGEYRDMKHHLWDLRQRVSKTILIRNKGKYMFFCFFFYRNFPELSSSEVQVQLLPLTGALVALKQSRLKLGVKWIQEQDLRKNHFGQSRWHVSIPCYWENYKTVDSFNTQGSSTLLPGWLQTQTTAELLSATSTPCELLFFNLLVRELRNRFIFLFLDVRYLICSNIFTFSFLILMLVVMWLVFEIGGCLGMGGDAEVSVLPSHYWHTRCTQEFHKKGVETCIFQFPFPNFAKKWKDVFSNFIFLALHRHMLKFCRN